MKERVTLRCQACGEVENCNFYCELIIDNVVNDFDELLCPISGEEAEWYEVEKGDNTMTQLIVNSELQVGIPHNCPFRQQNEETGEIFCGVSDIEDCQNDTAFPQKCPLLKKPIKVMIV